MHRDLKMENVMVDVETGPDGEAEIICKVADFGFATILERNNMTRENLGTPLYMAPEIVSERMYDNKVDIWALGIMTYCLLNGGEFPFDGRSLV